MEKNHAREERVFLVRYKKHTGEKTFNNQEAMEEAICFGWIDTTIKRVDEERYGVTYVRRGKNSRWSRATQRRARQMIKEGKMAPAGLAAYREGLKKPVIDRDLPRNPETPDDVKKALGTHVKQFEELAPSTKRVYLYWILDAKRPETRKRRVEKLVARVKAGGRKPVIN